MSVVGMVLLWRKKKNKEGGGKAVEVMVVDVMRIGNVHGRSVVRWETCLANYWSI